MLEPTNDEVVIQVYEIIPAGYRWQVTEQVNCLFSRFSVHHDSTNGEMLIGGGNVVSYKITPLEKGEWKFAIAYGRSWMPEPIKTISSSGTW